MACPLSAHTGPFLEHNCPFPERPFMIEIDLKHRVINPLYIDTGASKSCTSVQSNDSGFTQDTGMFVRIENHCLTAIRLTTPPVYDSHVCVPPPSPNDSEDDTQDDLSSGKANVFMRSSSQLALKQASERLKRQYDVYEPIIRHSAKHIIMVGGNVLHNDVDDTTLVFFDDTLVFRCNIDVPSLHEYETDKEYTRVL